MKFSQCYAILNANARVSSASLRSVSSGFIADHLLAGDEMAATGGARKAPFAVKDKGKSVGVRIITFYTGPDIPVFLLNVFAKGDKVNLTKAERNELRKFWEMLPKPIG
jgi:hypothetical protein